MNNNQKIKVLCVDDSALIRSVMTEIINSQPDMTVVGTAADPLVARELIKATNPDVLTLDVEMPRMDGLEFLEKLMRLRPMPVLMVSSLTERGSEIAFTALELGAVDFVTKPKLGVRDGLLNYTELIATKIRAAAAARLLPSRRGTGAKPSGAAPGEAPLRSPLLSTEKLIIIGASTGGTEAIRVVLEAMPPDAPPIVITQHIPAAFSGPFAARMNNCSAMRVGEARDGQPIQQGHAYIAPGGQHLLVMWDGARHVCRLHDGPPVNRHKPSVDVLFRSMAASVGKATVAAVLTGMGDDGARGLLELSQAGAATLVQDEDSSVVWGMPGAAFKLGAAREALPLDQIAARLLRLARQPLDSAPRAAAH